MLYASELAPRRKLHRYSKLRNPYLKKTEENSGIGDRGITAVRAVLFGVQRVGTTAGSANAFPNTFHFSLFLNCFEEESAQHQPNRFVHGSVAIRMIWTMLIISDVSSFSYALQKIE